jgi:uncharacterized alpha/beta hydrolase family protein
MWLILGCVLRGFFVLNDICCSCKRSTKELECGQRVKDPVPFVDVNGHTGRVTSEDKLIEEIFEA